MFLFICCYRRFVDRKEILKNQEFWPVPYFPSERKRKKFLKRNTFWGPPLLFYCILFYFNYCRKETFLFIFFFFSFEQRESFRSRRLGGFIIDLESVNHRHTELGSDLGSSMFSYAWTCASGNLLCVNFIYKLA